MKIHVDPRCKINYASYYIWGFEQKYGIKNVSFDVHKFTDMPFETLQDYEQGFGVVVCSKKGCTRIFIDFHDSDIISQKHYEWADIYGKVNVNGADLKKYSKIKALGPGFGIDIFNARVCLLLIRLLFICKKPVGMATYIKNAIYMFVRRCKMDEYIPSTSEKDYIFSISTLWYDRDTYNKTNRFRGNFFRACKKIYSKVEGGFFYIRSAKVVEQFPQYSSYLEEYDDCLFTKRISPKIYVNKTKKNFDSFQYSLCSRMSWLEVRRVFCLRESNNIYSLN